MRHTLITLLALTITLAACAPDIPAAPTATVGPSATTAPAATATATETPTPTQPEISISELVSGFKLRTDRTYEIAQVEDNTCLVDTYNQACMAVKNTETGAWAQLDETDPAQAELMYGHLVPAGSTINTSGELTSSPEGYRYLPTDMFMLDWWKEEGKYNGETVTEMVVKAGIRDKDNKLHTVQIVVDVNGDGIRKHGAPITYFKLDEKTESTPFPVAGYNSLERAKPGQKLRVELPFPVTETSSGVVVPQLYVSSKNPVDNNQVKQVLAELYNSHLVSHLSKTEQEAMSGGKWPNRQVYIYEAGTLAIVLNTWTDMAPFLPEGWHLVPPPSN